jgi:tetratricopeptide (TPR) repeat protein
MNDVDLFGGSVELEVKRRALLIFDSAKDVSDPSERRALLAAECGNDEELKAEVLELLSADLDPTEFTAIVTSQEPELDPEWWLGRRVGPYKLVQVLGQGGQGFVFEGHRDDGEGERVVAIKLIQPLFAQTRFRESFLRERQILAHLDHPHIVHLYEFGTLVLDSGESYPYFVMQKVEGTPLTDYCSQKRLGLDARLALFLDVCRAVSHAHQQTILHRDLKPGNILVDSDGEVKLLDFGVAEGFSTDEDPGPSGDLQPGPMTIAYASPEQALGRPVNVQTDIYSLGVILYELVALRRPYELRGLSFEQQLSAITDTPVPLPSTVAPTLRTRLGRDLDAVILKAVNKVPRMRYQSVDQFASDIQAARECRAVAARHQSFAYRWTRFLLRHKAATALTFTSVAILLVGITTTMYQRANAVRERVIALRQSAEIRRFANSNLVEVLKILDDLPGATGPREVIARRTRESLEVLRRQGGNDPVFLQELATAFVALGDVQGGPSKPNLGNTKDARLSYESALDLLEHAARQGGHGEEFINLTSAAYNKLGNLIRYENPSAALQYSRRSVALFDSEIASLRSARARRQYADSLVCLGYSLTSSGAFGSGLAEYNKAYQILKGFKSEDLHNETTQDYLGDVLTALGNSMLAQGDLTGAREYFDEALQTRQGLARAHPNSVSHQLNLGIALASIGYVASWRSMPEDAYEHQRAALSIYERLASLDVNDVRAHDFVVSQHVQVAYACYRANRPDEALSHISVAEKLITESPSAKERTALWRQLVSCDEMRGDLEQSADRQESAIKYYRKAQSELQRLAESGGSKERLRDSQARLLERLDNDRDAAFQPGKGPRALALRIRESIVAADPSDLQARRNLALSHMAVARAHKKSGDFALATQEMREALAVCLDIINRNPRSQVARFDQATAWNELGEILLSSGEMREALALHRKALAEFDLLLQLDPDDRDVQHERLYTFREIGGALGLAGDRLGMRGNFQKALDGYEVLARRHEKEFDISLRPTTLVEFGNLSTVVGDLQQAEGLFQQAVQSSGKAGVDQRYKLDLKQTLAEALSGLARVKVAQFSFEDSLRLATRAAELFEELLRSRSVDTDLRVRQFDNYVTKAMCLHFLGRDAESRDAQKALAASRKKVAHLIGKDQMSRIVLLRGDLVAALGLAEGEDAASYLRPGLREFDQLPRAIRENPEMRLLEALTKLLYACAVPNKADAATEFASARQILLSLLAQNPANWTVRYVLVGSLMGRADDVADESPGDALQLYGQAEQLLTEPLSTASTGSRVDPPQKTLTTVEVLRAIGEIQRKRGEFELARRRYTDALARLEQLRGQLRSGLVPADVMIGAPVFDDPVPLKIAVYSLLSETAGDLGALHRQWAAQDKREGSCQIAITWSQKALQYLGDAEREQIEIRDKDSQRQRLSWFAKSCLEKSALERAK